MTVEQDNQKKIKAKLVKESTVLGRLKNLFRKKGPTTILIATPTYDAKDYCFDKWLNAILDLEIPDKVHVDILILENTFELLDRTYYIKIQDKIKSFGDTFALSHVSLPKNIPVNRRVAHLYNYIRGYFQVMEYDYLFIVEIDVILAKQDLLKLWNTLNKPTWKKLFRKKYSIATGVTWYPVSKLSDADIKKMKDEGVTIIPDEAIQGFGNTMVLKKLSLDTTVIKSYVEPLPIEINGKVGWVNIDMPPSKILGQVPDYEAYNIDDAKKMTGVTEVAACPVGCIMVHKKVFDKICFRFDSSLAIFNDWLFCIDARKRGYKIQCCWDIQPVHLHRDWSKNFVEEKK